MIDRIAGTSCPSRPPFPLMHLLYLDDSGSVRNATDKHVVLAGLSVSEKAPHWFGLELDKIAEKIWPQNPKGLEFRGADIFSGKKQWRGVGRDDRICASQILRKRRGDIFRYHKAKV